jgi:hypothetical protein
MTPEAHERLIAGARAFAQTRKGKPSGFDGDRHPGWKGGRYTARGYVFVRRPNHHLAQANGYVAEHRIVMEEKLGRRLEPGEQVHHIDGNGTNNAPDNLVALSKKAHGLLHRREQDESLKSPEVRTAAGKKAWETRRNRQQPTH